MRVWNRLGEPHPGVGRGGQIQSESADAVANRRGQMRVEKLELEAKLHEPQWQRTCMGAYLCTHAQTHEHPAILGKRNRIRT